MNINENFRYLQIGLPNDVLRRKLHGDFEGAVAAIDRHLASPTTPEALKRCLTVQREMILRLPLDYPYPKEEALALLAENRARFHAANLEVVAGTAPEALEALSAPDRVFLGGTSGSLEDILNVIFRKNPAARVVCTAVTLETVREAARCFAGLEGADMVQVAVTRTRPAGRYHLMDAQNPVWIFSGEGRA